MVAVSSGDSRMDPVFTDDDGRFAVPLTLPPPWTVRVSKAGRVGALATVPGEKAAMEMQVALPRSAAVTGRVRDLFGAPANGVFVTGRQIVSGAETAASTPARVFTQTDGLGEYRLAGLPAGRYEILAARVPPELRSQGATLEDRLFGSRASLDVSTEASTLTLRAGDELPGVDFQIPVPSETCPTGSPQRAAPEAVASAVGGRVTGPSGEPLACAVVRVVSDASVPAAYTDSQGRYSIQGLRAGALVLEARKPGYLTLRYGQRRPGDAALPVTLREGEEQMRVDIVLPRGSTISGTVLDEHGEPVEGLIVLAAVVRRVAGRHTLISTEIPRPTDDRGRYRIIGLNPGSYVVAVRARGILSTAANEPSRGYAPVYYPGTTDVSAAARVTVDAGRDAEGLDVAFAPTRTATVSGWAFDAEGRPLAGTVALSASERSGRPSFDSQFVPIEQTGRFTIHNVAPGDYVVQAQGRPGVAPRFAIRYVTVDEGDPPPVTIVATEQAVVEGRVTTDEAVDPRELGILVSVEAAHPDFAPVPGSELGRALGARGGANSTLQEGRFRIQNVTGPTRFVVQASSCADCFLKSVTVNGADATDAPYDFGLEGGTFRDVELVVSDAGATIQGTAADERNRPAAAWVVVFPTDRELRYPTSRHMKTSPTEGTFRVSGLPPGSYFVAAISRDLAPTGGAIDDPDVLEELSTRAERVTLTEREQRTVNVRVSGR
jgi:hypothetical protein